MTGLELLFKTNDCSHYPKAYRTNTKPQTKLGTNICKSVDCFEVDSQINKIPDYSISKSLPLINISTLCTMKPKVNMHHATKVLVIIIA